MWSVAVMVLVLGINEPIHTHEINKWHSSQAECEMWLEQEGPRIGFQITKEFGRFTFEGETRTMRGYIAQCKKFLNI